MSNFDNILNKKYLKIILMLLCGVIGIFLLVSGDGGVFGKNDDVDKPECELPSAEEYEEQIEKKIVRLCSSVKGVDNVSAVVTLGGGYNAIYAQQSQASSGGYRNEFVLVGGGTNEEPLLIGYKPPDIAGIGIICTMGSDEYVKCEIISLVSAALGISPSKIYVATAKK